MRIWFHRSVTVALALAILLAPLQQYPPTAVAAAPGAADPPLSVDAAVTALQAYGIVDKKAPSELRLTDPVTRAEVAKLLGAALKEQAAAAGLQSSPVFADTDGHWANGWIGVTRDRGIFLGRTDGLFHPQDPVTYAEVLTALLRTAGRGNDAAKDWPYGAVLAAAELDMIPADMGLSGRILEPAPRGDVFRLVAIGLSRVPVLGFGKPVLQRLHDQTPPLLSLRRFPTQTSLKSLTVTGEVGDALYVVVQGKLADLLPDGLFTARLELEPGENVIPVAAVDGAGNRIESTARITLHRVVKVAVEPEVLTATVGIPFTIPIYRYDYAGVGTLADDAVWRYDALAFALDAATGRFTPRRPGEYTFRGEVDGMEAVATVRVAGDPVGLDVQVDHSILAAGGGPTAVRIRVVDEAGLVNSMGTRTVQLTVTPPGMATLEMTSVTTRNGEAVVYLTPGVGTGAIGIQAKSSGKPELLSPLLPVQVEEREITGIRLQALPAHVQPLVGQTVQVVATAVDQTGLPIPVPEDMTVTLASSDSSVLRVVSPPVIKAGTSSSEAGGTHGNAVTGGGAGRATVTGWGAGGLPVASTRFVAGGGIVLDRLEILVEQEVALADDLNAAIVSVRRLDSKGLVVVGDRSPVVVMSPTASVTSTPMSDSGGVATFAVRSSSAGRFTLTAGVPGRPELNSQPAQVAFVQARTAGVKPVIRVGASSVRAGGTLPAFVALLDSSGGAMPNPGPPLRYQVQSSAGGALSESELVIPTGATRSQEMVLLNVAEDVKSVQLIGTAVGGKALAAVTVQVQQPPKQAAAPTGPNIVVLGPPEGQSLVAGEETRFMIRMRNGTQVLEGSQAFDLKVRLNGRELTTLPPGLEVTFRNGTALGGPFRTVGGEAEVWVKYTGAGTVELVPVPRGYTANATDPWGTTGAGDATTGSTIITARASYVAGPIARLEAIVTPNLGKSTEGFIKASIGRYATVRVAPVDQFGNPAGSYCAATLVRSRSLGIMPIRLGWGDVTEYTMPVPAGGSAEFTVITRQDTPAWSEWIPRVVCGSTVLTTQETVRISAVRGTAPVPSIESAGGNINAGGVYVDDSYLQIRIATVTSSISGAAELVVYDGDRYIGQYGPVYPTETGTAGRTVSIPKADLGVSGRNLSLRVRLNVGSDVSELSGYASVYFSQ